MSKSYLLEFLKEKLINSAVLGTITGIILWLPFGQQLAINYIAGLLIGIMNFVLLTIGYELVLSFRPMVAKIVHFVFWALRYVAIAAFIVYYYLHKDANIYAVIAGLLTMHISIFLSEMKKHLFFRKEG